MIRIHAVALHRQSNRVVHTVFSWAVATTLAAAAGCASQSPPPPDLDLRNARIVPMTAMPVLDVSGLPGGKAVGAAVGAGTGSGAGVAASALVCLSTGPFFPLCIATVLPTTVAIGAATGAIIGGVRTEGTDAIQVKTRVLAHELAEISYHQLLVLRLRDQLREESDLDLALDVPASGASVEGDGSGWTMETGVVEVGTEGKATFALRLVVRLALRRGDAAPTWEARREVQSETELTTAQWIADDSRALRGVLDVCLHQAAHQLATHLGPGSPGGRPAQTRAPARYSSSCRDNPASWLNAAF
jgi:hypothetical protein